MYRVKIFVWEYLTTSQTPHMDVPINAYPRLFPTVSFWEFPNKALACPIGLPTSPIWEYSETRLPKRNPTQSRKIRIWEDLNFLPNTSQSYAFETVPKLQFLGILPFSLQNSPKWGPNAIPTLSRNTPIPASLFEGPKRLDPKVFPYWSQGLPKHSQRVPKIHLLGNFWESFGRKPILRSILVRTDDSRRCMRFYTVF
eukprot:jgi/Botrbrau1/15829/Bobra.40_1s0015.1